MLDEGVKPFVELGFVPKELATVTNTDFWWQANGSPPKDNAKWEALVRALVEHCIARYGVDEVRSWYFEVWNEPNLRYFFKNGTQAQYFELYRVTALALKSIDPHLRVGCGRWIDMPLPYDGGGRSAGGDPNLCLYLGRSKSLNTSFYIL